MKGCKTGLTDEEKTRPYALYFDRTPVAPPKESLSPMAAPMDPSEALLPEDLNELPKPGCLASEVGWCVMPNGSGYVSCLTTMPGVTPRMIDWWFAWQMQARWLPAWGMSSRPKRRSSYMSYSRNKMAGCSIKDVGLEKGSHTKSRSHEDN